MGSGILYAYEYNDTNWKDKLTKFDGNTITYDAIGNPLSDGTWTYVWQAGRQLKSMSKSEGSNTVTMEFTYNHAGLRTKKVRKVNGVVKETTEYTLNGKNVVELIHTDSTTGTTPTVNKLHFYYDAQGRVALVDFNGTKYSYAHNLQGDIIGILDTNGSLVVEYKYDAWGKPTSTTGTLTTTLGQLNPFRYRGYVWDGETKLYYLRSRFYCPIESRFVNCDYLLRLRNAFHYCFPNPIRLKDESGCKEQRAGDYLVVLNIRIGEDEDDPGHFSFSLISINSPKTSRINFSYGPGSVIDEEEKEYTANLTISYVPRHKLDYRYIVCTISCDGCSEILDFVFDQFINEKQILAFENKVFTKHPVKDPWYKIYDGGKGHYCGSATGYILINCNDVYNDTKGRNLAALLHANVIYANPKMLCDGDINIIDYLESNGYEQY